MKDFTNYKVVQLSLFIVYTLIGCFLLMQEDIKAYVFSNKPATILFFLFWVLLLSSFIFLILDFNMVAGIKVGDESLYGIAHADQLTNLPNRFSCDAIIEKYSDVFLPTNIGCIMIDLTNLAEINTSHGHHTGNNVLKEFSGILSGAAVSLCFVGRNGGNKFLAVFEDCTRERLEMFQRRVKTKVDEHNAKPGAIPIEYRLGVALNSDENYASITKLISLANQRIYES